MNMHMVRSTLVSLMLAAALAGCGGGAPPSASTPPGSTSGAVAQQPSVPSGTSTPAAPPADVQPSQQKSVSAPAPTPTPSPSQSGTCPRPGPARGTADSIGVMLQLDNLLEVHHTGDGAFDDVGAAQVKKQFATLGSAHVKWVRVGVMWDQIEPQKPINGRHTYHWKAADLVVQEAARNGVQLDWIVGSTPPWDTRTNCNSAPPITIPDPNFGNFLAALVLRYEVNGIPYDTQGTKAHVNVWEIRNEPDCEPVSNAKGAPSWQPEEYTLYLNQAWDVIRLVELAQHVKAPSTVVMGGLGSGPASEAAFLSTMIKKNAKFDVANFHIYPQDADVDGPIADRTCVGGYLEWSESVIEPLLAGKPVWITEFDYPSSWQAQLKDSEYYGPKRDGVEYGEAVQADFVTDWLARFLGTHGDRRIFWASLLDDDNDQGYWHTGLFEVLPGYPMQMGAPKPAWSAFLKVIQ